ncbi:uncharacterized protein LOC125856052 [Solanum stenotomum]|uniref:uncharacterized protein LOC125856052 n=1 Tax=Solanum stenotomum TaxID=172797 RepID=UPI0020D07217|nr:uncharacterized protein LOC125856052 [Solanum stenotomum]
MDIHTLHAEAVLLTPAPGPSRISSASPSMTLSSSTTPLAPRSVVSVAHSQPLLTQAAILRIGHLAHSADRHASRLETIASGMIERALTAVMALLNLSINAFAVRREVCERVQGATHEVTTLKAAIVELRKDVDQLKSTNMFIIFGTVEILDMPVDTDVPPTTTGVVPIHDMAASESKVETDEEQLGLQEETTYEGLIGVEEAMMDSALQISLVDTSMAGSGGASVSVRPGI